jgi:hypothetical protein
MHALISFLCTWNQPDFVTESKLLIHLPHDFILDHEILMVKGHELYACVDPVMIIMKNTPLEEQLHVYAIICVHTHGYVLHAQHL